MASFVASALLALSASSALSASALLASLASRPHWPYQPCRSHIIGIGLNGIISISIVAVSFGLVRIQFEIEMKQS
jgi:hypothetical protein